MKKLIGLLLCILVFTSCASKEKELPYNQFYDIQSDKYFAYIDLGGARNYQYYLEKAVELFDIQVDPETVEVYGEGLENYVFLVPKNSEVSIHFGYTGRVITVKRPVVWRKDDTAKITVGYKDDQQVVDLGGDITAVADILSYKQFMDPQLFTDDQLYRQELAKIGYSDSALKLLDKVDFVNEDDKRIFLLTAGRHRLLDEMENIEDDTWSSGYDIRQVVYSQADGIKKAVFLDNLTAGTSVALPPEYWTVTSQAYPAHIHNGIFYSYSDHSVALFYHNDVTTLNEIFKLENSKTHTITGAYYHGATKQMIISYCKIPNEGETSYYNFVITDILGKNKTEVTTDIPVEYTDGEITMPNFSGYMANSDNGKVTFRLGENEYAITIPDFDRSLTEDSESYSKALADIGYSQKDIDVLESRGNFEGKEGLRIFLASAGKDRALYEGRGGRLFLSPDLNYAIRNEAISWGGEGYSGALFLENLTTGENRVINSDLWPLTPGNNPIFIDNNKFICYWQDKVGLLNVDDPQGYKTVFRLAGDTHYIRYVYNNKRDENIVIAYCRRLDGWEDKADYTLVFAGYDGNVIKTVDTDIPASMGQRNVYYPDFETCDGLHPEGKLMAHYAKQFYYILDLTTGKSEEFIKE